MCSTCACSRRAAGEAPRTAHPAPAAAWGEAGARCGCAGARAGGCVPASPNAAPALKPARSVWPLPMGQGCHPPLRMPVWRPCIASVSSGDATLVSSQPKCVMVAPRPGVGAHGLVGGLVPRAGPGPARAALCQGRVAAAGRNRRARRRQPAGRGRARAARRRRARRAAGQAQALRRRSRRAAPPMPGRCRSRDRVCCAQSRRRQGGRGRRPALPGCACAACWLRRGEACSQVRLFRQWAGGRRYGKPHVDRLGMLLFFVKCAQVCAL